MALRMKTTMGKQFYNYYFLLKHGIVIPVDKMLFSRSYNIINVIYFYKQDWQVSTLHLS